MIKQRYYRQSGFVVAHRTRQDVRDEAHLLIDRVKHATGASSTPFPICGLIELWGSECGSRPGIDVPNFDIVEPEDLAHADAEFDPVSNLIRIDQTVWDAASDGDADGRWTLAHEVGHVVLKHYAAAGRYLEGQIVHPDTDSEHQSNWFADELLMDSREIDIHRDGTSAIVTRFRVNEALATRRIRELVLQNRR